MFAERKKGCRVLCREKVSGHIIDLDITRNVQSYIDYVRSYETDKSKLFTEKLVNFSNIVPGGFGTMDSAVIQYDTGFCHIFDFKYGKYVKVDAFQNTQSQLYSIGMCNESDFPDEITNFRIHIVQPHMCNYSDWDTTVKDLVDFGKWVAERAELALTIDAPRVPGEIQCKWCPAKGNCKALLKFTEQTILSEFNNLDEIDTNALSDDQKRTILDNKKLIESFLKSVESDVIERMKLGEEFKGYKLVEGRKMPKWTDGAEKSLREKLGDGAYLKKLISIKEAKNIISKDEVDKLTYKPPGNLILVPESDKRKAVNKTNIADEFDEVLY